MPCNYTVEGDFTQMAVFAVAGFLNGDILCKNINYDVVQADRRVLDFGKAMGGSFEPVENGYCFHKSATKGITIDLGQSPDIGPIMALLGALSEGTTIIDNASRLKFKESNRLQTTYETLKTLGVDIEITESSLIIKGQSALEGGTLSSFNDHRIVMLAAIASSRSTKPVLITNAEAIKKSYPDFFIDFAKIGGNFTVIEG
jgi:3-phosphoshikimate 1-carboxyvinyltransferase